LPRRSVLQMLLQKCCDNCFYNFHNLLLLQRLINRIRFLSQFYRVIGPRLRRFSYRRHVVLSNTRFRARQPSTFDEEHYHQDLFETHGFSWTGHSCTFIVASDLSPTPHAVLYVHISSGSYYYYYFFHVPNPTSPWTHRNRHAHRNDLLPDERHRVDRQPIKSL
jgi:hypothetical protein